MQVRSPLMIEHSLIKRMVSIINEVLSEIETNHEVDPVFVDTTADFIRRYADQTHHGKEEDILFRELNNKDLDDDDRRIMQELIDEHVFGRQTTRALVDANNRYRNGDDSALPEIVDKLQTLAEFYPRHIDKEDKVFFLSTRKYISEEENDAMLEEFWEFDRKMIHDKYASIVEGFET